MLQEYEATETPNRALPTVYCQNVDQPTLSVRFSCPRAEFPTRLADAFCTLLHAFTSARATPAGPLFAALHCSSDHRIAAEAGVPIAASFAPQRPVAIGSIPMGRYLALVQKGNEPELTHTSRRVADWLQKQHEVTMGPIYVHLLEVDPVRRQLLVSIQRRITAGASPEQRELSELEREGLHAILGALARLSEHAATVRRAAQRGLPSDAVCGP